MRTASNPWVFNPYIAPVSWVMALDRCDWTPSWTEDHSHSYGLKEAQVQSYMDKPGPGYWRNMRVNPGG